jgi:hypothetical protein
MTYEDKRQLANNLTVTSAPMKELCTSDGYLYAIVMKALQKENGYMLGAMANLVGDKVYNMILMFGNSQEALEFGYHTGQADTEWTVARVDVVIRSIMSKETAV